MWFSCCIIVLLLLFVLLINLYMLQPTRMQRPSILCAYSAVAAYSYLKSSSSFLFSCDKVSYNSNSMLCNHLQVFLKL
jgi:hypothetical protein